jgi:hypothetical protein
MFLWLQGLVYALSMTVAQNFSCAVVYHLNNNFPGQWICYGSLDNCPGESPNLNPHGLLNLVVDEKSGL